MASTYDGGGGSAAVGVIGPTRMRYSRAISAVECPNEKKETVIDQVVNQMKDSKDVIKIDRTDGGKLYTKDGWVLMRPSGTEPIFRVYVETKEKPRGEQLMMFYKNLVESLIERV